MTRHGTALAGAGVLTLCVAAGVAAMLGSAAPASEPEARNLTLATSIAGDDVTVSALERGLPITEARAPQRAARPAPTPAPAPAESVPAEEPLPAPAAAAEVIEVPELAPAAEVEALPVRLAVATSSSSGAMSLAPGESMSVTTASSAGTGAERALPPGIFRDARGPAVRLGGGIGGGHCGPRGGGGTLVLR